MYSLLFAHQLNGIKRKIEFLWTEIWNPKIRTKLKYSDRDKTIEDCRSIFKGFWKVWWNKNENCERIFINEGRIEFIEIYCLFAVCLPQKNIDKQSFFKHEEGERENLFFSFYHFAKNSFLALFLCLAWNLKRKAIEMIQNSIQARRISR